MIEFNDITLQDKTTITSFTMNSYRRNCDLSFSNLCSWRFIYNTKFAIVDDFLVFKFRADNKLAYMMPVGQGDLKKVLQDLEEDARQEGEPFCMLGTCSGVRAELENIMPGRFTFTADRNYADYIYFAVFIPPSAVTIYLNIKIYSIHQTPAYFFKQSCYI